MSSFKSKLAFFQNAALQQQSHQQQFYQQPICQQQYPTTRQSQNPSLVHKTNPTPVISNNTESQIHTSINRPSIVVPKPIVTNSNFKSKLAFFNQQPTPLAPLYSGQTNNASNQTNSEHIIPKTSYLLPQNRVVTTQPSSNIDGNNHEITNINNTSIQISATNNENIPQPVNNEYKAQQSSQPPKSFKDKLALLSSIQQPMGIYDYKKKQNSNQHRNIEPTQTFSNNPTQTFSEQSTITSQDLPVQQSSEQILPSLTAGRARRSTRRPTSLNQSNL